MDKNGDQQTDMIKSYQTFFETEDGQVVLFDIMKKGRIFSSTLGASPEETARNEGQRELVLYILSQIGRDLEALYEFKQQQEEIQKGYN